MQDIASGADDEEQNVEDELKNLLGKEMYEKLYLKIKSEFKKESVEEKDRMKFKKLITEYKKFKRNKVQHFKFNSASEELPFGLF